MHINISTTHVFIALTAFIFCWMPGFSVILISGFRISNSFLMLSFLQEYWVKRPVDLIGAGSPGGQLVFASLVSSKLYGNVFSEEEDLIWGCRVSWIQGICGFFGLLSCFKSLFLWDRKTIRLRSSLDGPQARKIRVYLPWKSRSRAFSLPTNVVVAGDGMQWWFTCLWDLVQLLQHFCLQESLILGCGLFQLR